MPDAATMLPHALAAIDAVLVENADTKRDEWLTLTVQQHVEHAKAHVHHVLEFFGTGLDRSQDLGGHDFDTHLLHALTRLAMAVELYERGQS